MLPSCGDTPTCVDGETSLVKIQFIDEDGADKNITLTSLKAIGNEDGFPEYTDTTVNLLSLPLNPGSYTTTFILDQASQTDTIGLSYNVVAQLISPECGLDAAFSELDTIYNSFVKLEILSTTIHEQVEVNIEVTH